jgi:hypothetical protein
MPNPARLLIGGEELVGKIDQHLHSIGRPDRNAQCPVTDQYPAMIIINCPVPKIKRCPTYVPTAVIEGEKESARQPREAGIGTESGIEPDDQGPDVSGATANPGKRRGDDIADPLMGLRRQKARLSHCIDKASGHRVRQATQLHAGPRGQLQIAAAEFLRNPAQSAKRRTGCLPARNPDPDYGPILCQMGP